MTRLVDGRGAGWRLLLACLGLSACLALHGAGCSGANNAPKTLQLPSTSARISGDVYDLDSGMLLTGAVLMLENGLVSYTTVSDGRGVYLFADVAPGDYQLTAGRAGFTTARHAVRLLNGQSDVRNVGLQPTTLVGNLLGRVLRYEGGAEPTVPLTGALVSIPALRLTSHADAQGRFWFHDLPAGFQTLTFTLAGYRDTDAVVDVPPQDTLVLPFEMMDVAGTLEGHVRGLPGSTPLTSVLVSLPELGLTTLTGPDGSWRLDRVTSGFRGVDFQAPSHDAARLTTSVVAGRVTTLDALLSSSFGTVWGTVRDPFLVPLANVVVSIPTGGLTTSTDMLGRYVFPGTVHTGTFVPIGSTKSGYLTSGTWITLGPSEVATVDFVLVPSVGAATGTVYDRASLSPIAGAVCSITYLGVSVVTNASGIYAFSGLSPGSVPVRVSAVGYTTLTTPAAVVAGATTVTNIYLSSSS